MLAKFKSYLESVHVTPVSWLVGVSAVLMVRFFLESFSSRTSSGLFASDASTLIHYYLFFISVGLVCMVFVEKVLPRWKLLSPQIVATSLVFVLIAPLVDLVVSRGNTVMTYFFGTPTQLAAAFLTYFGQISLVGITLGIRVEVAFLILALAWLVYKIEKSVWRTVISFLGLYALIFVFLSLPSWVSIVVQGFPFAGEPLKFFQNTIINSVTVSNNLHTSLQYVSITRFLEISFNFIMAKVLFLIALVAASFWFALNYRTKFKSVIKNSRPERVAFYTLLILFGIFSARFLFPAQHLVWNDWLSVITLCLAFYFSWMFAVLTNDLVDEEVDIISNPGRPLVAGTLTKEDMKQTAFIFLVALLLAGYLAGYTAFFFVLTFTALYYVYSVPPTRLKLISFLSSFLIGLCSLTAVLAGFFLISPFKTVSSFPLKLAFAIVLIFSLGVHIRDLKDIEGDRKAGIKTVPVLFGPVWGPRIVGLFTAVAFLLVPLFFKIYILFIPAVCAAAAVYYFANRKNYREIYIFYTYFIFIIISGLLFLGVS